MCAWCVEPSCHPYKSIVLKLKPRRHTFERCVCTPRTFGNVCVSHKHRAIHLCSLNDARANQAHEQVAAGERARSFILLQWLSAYLSQISHLGSQSVCLRAAELVERTTCRRGGFSRWYYERREGFAHIIMA